MAAFTIDGTTLEISDGGEGEPIPIGDQSRAFAGNLRSSERDGKRQFSVVTVPTLVATCDTVRAATANGAQVTVSGDVLSGASYTASCRASVKGVAGLPGYFIMSINGQEV